LVKRLDQYVWSSRKGYISSAKKWNWLYKDFTLRMLSDQKSSRIRIYKQFITQQQDQDPLSVFGRKNQPSMIGSQEFIARIKDKFFKKKKDKEIPASKGLATDVDKIIYDVSRYYENRPTILTAVRRRIENEPRDVAIYLIRALRTEPLMKIGGLFGLTRYSSVSSVVRRVKTRLNRDRKFRRRLADIENNILKSQM
jgi:hypothetical protein